MLRINQKPLTRCTALLLALLLNHSVIAQGDTCNDPLDISADLPVNGSHSFTVDTSDGDKYYSFTASEAGTFEISTCSNPTYLIVYDDACNVLHEQGMASCGTSLYALELAASETIKLEFDARNNVAGFESTTATAYFQEEVAGQDPAEAIALTEGINTMTRYLGKQYFSYQATQPGLLTIRTCNDGNSVDGTELRLYDNAMLETLLVDNAWCSNDPDGDLTQSILEYTISASETVILEAKQAFFWYASYEFEVQFEATGASCENPISTSAGNSYDIDHAPDGGDYQSEFWYSYTADADGQLTITNCDLIPGITKVTVFDECGGTKLGVADGNCNGGAHIAINLTAGERIHYKWDDHNEPDWNLEDYAYSFNVTFEAAGTGASCESPILISSLGIYDVDNTNGHQWFAFTAPETMEVGISTGAASQEWGYVDLGNYQDTWFNVYDACGGDLIGGDDDTPLFRFGRSYDKLEVTAGTTYLIEWEDFHLKDPFQYQFEIFENENVFVGATEAEAVSVDVGVHRALLSYKDEHWFKYTFPSDGVLVAVNLDIEERRVIPSYQMLYGNNGLDLELPYADEFSVENYDDDEPAETNFLYEGVAGEEVLLRVWEAGGLNFDNVGNVDFELAFFEGAVIEDLCYYESDLTAGVHQVNSADGDQQYKFTATVAGTHIFSAEDDPSILISVYDLCFDDPLYTKYNNFYYEKEMVVGEELYFVFSDEYGGACDFEIIAPLECIGCNEWLGTNPNWFDINNWSDGTVPLFDNVLIPPTANDPILIGEAEVLNLYLDHNATITIESGSSLIIEGIVEGSGEAIVRRNTVGDAGYSIIGSPVQNEAVDDLNADYIYAFDGQDYVVPTGQLNVGEGYFAGFNAAAPFVEFRGTPNHGDIFKSLTEDGMFQLLSNPYTTALDYNTFVFDNLETIGTTIYLWDDGGLNQGTIRGGGYVTVSTVGVTGNSGTKGPGIWTGSIPTAQGFYVFVEQPGTVNFNRFQLFGIPGSNADGGFYRTAEETKKVRLTISNDEFEDDLLIGFREDATDGIDLGLDARKLRNNHLSFFSIAEGSELAIQALNWEPGTRIPLGVVISEPGSHDLSATEWVGLSDEVEITLMPITTYAKELFLWSLRRVRY